MKNVTEYHARMQAATLKWETARNQYQTAKSLADAAWALEQESWNEMADLMLVLSHQIEEG